MLKRFLIAAALILGCGCFSYGQGIRIGDNYPITSSLTTPGFVSTVSNALINVCTFPANAVPCTNKATTYTSVTLGTPCSTSTQVVLFGTNSCVSTTDGRGNWGAWVAAGNYDFTVTVSTGQSFGPFTLTAGIPSGTNLSLGSLTVTGALNANGGGALNGIFTGPTKLTGANTQAQQDNVIYEDGVTYTGAQALQTAIQACSTFTNGCVVDARNPNIGTQTFTVNPFSGLNMAVTLSTGPYTVQWDPTSITVDLPPNLHWNMGNTYLLNTNPNGVSLGQDPLAQIHTFLGGRIYKTTGTITTGTNSLSVASATGVQVDSLVGIWGAGGSNTNQNTTLSAAITLTGATSFSVNSTAGWDLTRPSDQFVVQIDSEYILCTGGVANTSMTGCTRGAFGTTAATHLINAPVNFVPLFLAQVTAVAGTTLTLSSNASATVTGATVWIGSDRIVIDGQGVIDGAQPQTGTDNFLAGVVLLQGTNVYIAPGILVRRFEHAGVIAYGGWFNRVYAASELNGKPPAAKGTDIWLFGQSSNNFVAPAMLGSGDNSFNINDRTTNADPWSGPANNNTAYLPSTTGVNYTNGATIQCICSNNSIYVGTIAVTGNAISINNNNGNWQPANTTPPTGNVIKFGSISTTGTNAISTSGYVGNSSMNRIEGGTVTAGAVSAVASGGDTVIWKDSTGNHTIHGGTSGLLPAFAAQNSAFSIDANVAQGSGTAKGGFFSACRGATDAAGDHCYGGWFKSTSQNQGSNEVGVHAEAADATGTIAEFAQGGSVKSSIDGTGALRFTALLLSPTAPTITGAGCGGTVAAIQNANGTASFEIFTGTAPTSAGCTVTFPTAAHHWICPNISHASAVSTTNFIITQVGPYSSTSVTFQLFSDVAAATAPAASDTWAVSGCHAN